MYKCQLIRHTLSISRILRAKVNRPLSINRHGGRRFLQSSAPLFHIFDARDKDVQEQEKKLSLTQSQMFEDAGRIQKARDEKAFKLAIHKFRTRVDKYNKGNVEFVYAAMGRMKEFNVHRNLSVYKEIVCIFPKDKMVPETAWQVEMMHYPKQQQCCIDLLDFMENYGVCPDDAFGYLLKDRFGLHAHVFRKYRRMMYWMPKFKHANPYPVPYDLPEDARDLARLALERMCPDPLNEIKDFDTKELESEEVFDETFVVSAQSPGQKELLSAHDTAYPVYVEGGFTEWMRTKSVTYFILRAEATRTFKIYDDHMSKEFTDEEIYTDFLQDIPFFGTKKKKPSSLVVKPSLHEQRDGTILAMCITGTGSKNSLVSWITWLQQTNPVLASVPVIFTLKTPETGLQVVKGEAENKAELAHLTL